MGSHSKSWVVGAAAVVAVAVFVSQRGAAAPVAAQAGGSPLLATLRDHYRDEPDEADKLLSVGIAPRPGPDADLAELAAWANACRVILNLHETITRD